ASSPAVVGESLRMGGADRRLRSRGRGLVRMGRSDPVHRGERRVRMGGAETRLETYDAIAELYDPWSRSVTEDIPFYVAEAVGAGGPIGELRVGRGRSSLPTAAAGASVVGVD